VRRHHHYYVTALPKQVRSRSKFAAVCFDVLQNVNVKDQIELMSHYAGDRSLLTEQTRRRATRLLTYQRGPGRARRSARSRHRCSAGRPYWRPGPRLLPGRRPVSRGEYAMPNMPSSATRLRRYLILTWIRKAIPRVIKIDLVHKHGIVAARHKWHVAPIRDQRKYEVERSGSKLYR